MDRLRAGKFSTSDAENYDLLGLKSITAEGAKKAQRAQRKNNGTLMLRLSSAQVLRPFDRLRAGKFSTGASTLRQTQGRQTQHK